MVFLAAVFTVHLVRREVSRSVNRKSIIAVQTSVFFQPLPSLQNLEQLRETTPQLPRTDFVKTFSPVRRYAFDAVQGRKVVPNRFVGMRGFVELQKRCILHTAKPDIRQSV